LISAVERRFGKDTVLFEGEATPRSTGWMEVQVVGGNLLHSKRGGDGYIDSQAKLDTIFAGIEAAQAHAAANNQGKK
jgi:hypothetical protein